MKPSLLYILLFQRYALSFNHLIILKSQKNHLKVYAMYTYMYLLTLLVIIFYAPARLQSTTSLEGARSDDLIRYFYRGLIG